MKGVILAGGTGSRLHPLTRITNKHLLPIYDRPMVTYAIEAIVSAGISELMLVTGGTHAGEFFRLLGDGHCARDRPALLRLPGAGERHRRRAGPGGALRGRRPRPRHARGQHLRAVDQAGDRQLRAQERGARIVLSKVEEPEHLRHLGVAELDGDRVTRIVEKPEQPPSDYAVTGLYFYDPSVFEFLPTLSPSARGELEITDVNNWFVEQGTMEYDVAEGFWGDAGESIDAYYAVNDFVRQNGANK